MAHAVTTRDCGRGFNTSSLNKEPPYWNHIGPTARTGSRTMRGVLRRVGAKLSYDWPLRGLCDTLEMPLGEAGPDGPT